MIYIQIRNRTVSTRLGSSAIAMLALVSGAQAAQAQTPAAAPVQAQTPPAPLRS